MYIYIYRYHSVSLNTKDEKRLTSISSLLSSTAAQLESQAVPKDAKRQIEDSPPLDTYASWSDDDTPYQEVVFYPNDSTESPYV